MSIKTLFHLSFCLVLAACAGADTSETEAGDPGYSEYDEDDGTDSDAEVDDDSNESGDGTLPEYDCGAPSVFCISLLVPADYAGTPRNLFVGLYDSLPPVGPPTIFLFDEDAPAFTPGEAINLSLRDDVPDSGEYFLFSVLYDQTGGEWMPEPGIDYVATSDAPYAFDGQGMDVGEVNFSLYNGE